MPIRHQWARDAYIRLSPEQRAAQDRKDTELRERMRWLRAQECEEAGHEVRKAADGSGYCARCRHTVSRGRMLERELDQIQERNRMISAAVESEGQPSGEMPCPSGCGGRVRWERRSFSTGCMTREWTEITCTTQGCIGNSGI